MLGNTIHNRNSHSRVLLYPQRGLATLAVAWRNAGTDRRLVGALLGSGHRAQHGPTRDSQAKGASMMCGCPGASTRRGSLHLSLIERPSHASENPTVAPPTRRQFTHRLWLRPGIGGNSKTSREAKAGGATQTRPATPAAASRLSVCYYSVLLGLASQAVAFRYVVTNKLWVTTSLVGPVFSGVPKPARPTRPCHFLSDFKQTKGRLAIRLQLSCGPSRSITRARPSLLSPTCCTRTVIVPAAKLPT